MKVKSIPLLLLLPALMVVLAGCGDTVSPLPTYTPYPTYTPLPTDTPLPLEEDVTCTLKGGEVVEKGWSGKDTGSNYCNQCMCMSAGLTCTVMACPSVVVTATPTLAPTPALISINPSFTAIPTPTPPPTPIPNPAFRLPLDYQQFFDDIDQNIVAAKAKYAGQKLSFVGIVSRIYEDRVSVDFPPDDNWRNGNLFSRPTINCKGLDTSDLINLLPEDKITVQGISVFDYATDTFATLESCSILSYTAP